MGHSLVGVVWLCGYTAASAGSDVSYREDTEEHGITELEARQMGHWLKTQYAYATSNQLPPIAKRIAANPKTVENKSFVPF